MASLGESMVKNSIEGLTKKRKEILQKVIEEYEPKMNELEMLKETKLLGLFKYIIGFGLGKDDVVTADPWAPWPFP